MGEIGYDRKEYLYELSYCDILCIERGYYARYHQSWEQARLIAYCVHYCMGAPKGQTAKTVTEWLPFRWEKDKEPSAPISQQTADDLRRQMMEWNANIENEKSDK